MTLLLSRAHRLRAGLPAPCNRHRQRKTDGYTAVSCNRHRQRKPGGCTAVSSSIAHRAAGGHSRYQLAAAASPPAAAAAVQYHRRGGKTLGRAGLNSVTSLRALQSRPSVPSGHVPPCPPVTCRLRSELSEAEQCSESAEIRVRVHPSPIQVPEIRVIRAPSPLVSEFSEIEIRVI